MILLAIIIICFILYKSGAVGGFLKSCKVDEESQTPTPAAVEPKEGREKWENEARYILTMQGRVNPDTVKYMGDEMLIHIIREYLDI